MLQNKNECPDVLQIILDSENETEAGKVAGFWYDSDFDNTIC